MIQLPACPSTNGRLDFPCLQIFKLKVLSASKAPPNNTPVPKLTAFLEKTKPRSPPLKTTPPEKKKEKKEANICKNLHHYLPKNKTNTKNSNFSKPIWK
jgi:hypothetical protein